MHMLRRSFDSEDSAQDDYTNNRNPTTSHQLIINSLPRQYELTTTMAFEPETKVTNFALKTNGTKLAQDTTPSDAEQTTPPTRPEGKRKYPSHEVLRSELETPMIDQDLQLSIEEKQAIIEKSFREILVAMGLDITDDSLSGTPKRVAKMYVNELFKGLNPETAPAISLFENKYAYNNMLVERDIEVQSMCEHHLMPIIGKAHVAYIPNDHVIGLSKINRIVQYFCQRPQVQERLTNQIADYLKEMLKTDHVAVIVDSVHYCVKMRGIKDACSSTLTSSYHGEFQQQEVRNEFLSYVKGL